MPEDLRGLMEHFCRLGCLLPPAEDIEAVCSEETRLVLGEMALTQAKIDGFLGSKRVP